MTRFGFTGTQRGMTIEQGRQVLDLLKTATELRHGDCIGADKQAHDIALALRGQGQAIRLVGHPPESSLKRAWCKGFDDVRPCRGYLERDWDIAMQCDALIACTKGMEEEVRSGTWATIRYARKLQRHIYIILPDGRVKEENAK